MSTSSFRITHRILVQWLLPLCLTAALAAYYVFQGTNGRFATLAWNTEYYDLAVEGFRRGHLHLAVEPSPWLLIQQNPYDPQLRSLWLWDALLYKGRYYIYWGPVPALCLWAFKGISGHEAKVHDQWLVLAFMLGRLLFGAALIWSIASRANRRVPRWASALAVVVFAFASPTLFVMARPVIYEASIAAGQCFLYAGMLAAFWALALPAWRTPLALLASLAWGLAFNSRVTLLLVVPLLAASSAFLVFRRSGWRWRSGLSALLAFGTPLGLCLLACGWYNYARFGSATDFGVSYQLTGRPFTTSSIYVLPNLVSYLTAGLDWRCSFPYVILSLTRIPTPLITWPADYDLGGWVLGERVGGVLVVTPFCWLIGWLPVRWLLRSFRRRRQLQGGETPVCSKLECWAIACGLAITLSLVPALGAYTASMRYLEDAGGGLLLAASVAGFALLRTSRASSRGASWLGATAFTGLALYTIFVGVCLGFTGHAENFIRENQPLFLELLTRFSVCTWL